MSNVVPLIPDTAPFTAEQRAWLNGFFAGVFSRAAAPQTPPAATASAAALQPLTILFGSQTGTAEGLAKRAAKEAGKRGFAATVLDMAQTDLAKLAAEKTLLVITSTYGDGEPPDNAKALHGALQVAASAGTRPLSALRFSVCSLGDTNYTQFCKCGEDFDVWLEKLGGTRSSTRVDCDLEYEEKFASWLDTALRAFASGTGSAAAAVTAPAELKKTDVTHESASTRIPVQIPIQRCCSTRRISTLRDLRNKFTTSNLTSPDPA
jgi:sulfite reductase (NADPH) flavoprotein alpha-component